MHARILISILAALTLASAAARAEVRWAPELERGPGAGYNQAHYDRRVNTPKSVLKNSRANRLVHRERKFVQRLGSGTRQTMRHRGDVARHGRINGQVKSTLSRQARPAPMTQARLNRSLGRETRATLQHRGAVARQARSGQRVASGGARAAQRSHAARSTARVARRAGTTRNVATTAKRARSMRTLGKAAAGGVVVAGGIYATEQALGVDIPDAIDAAEWSYGTLKDPENAGRRFEKLGHDSVREVNKGLRTLSDPNRMARNVERSVNSTAKSISKAGCSVGKLFGASC